MEVLLVLLGYAFTIEVPSSPPHSPPEYGGERPTTDQGGDDAASSQRTSFFDGGSGFRVGGQQGFFTGDSSESSSSIGSPDNSDDENDDVSSREGDDEEGKEVQSTLKGLGSLDSLEDSLPIRRGLSSHFAGKTKSFTDLSQVSSVKELQKQENPFNKRRRVRIASKRSRRSPFYAYSNPKSMPLLPLNEEEEEEKEEEKDRKVSPCPPASSSSAEEKPRDEVCLRQQSRVPRSYADHMRLGLGSFKSRSLSLADLQEHDDEEEEEEDDDDDDDDY